MKSWRDHFDWPRREEVENCKFAMKAAPKYLSFNSNSTRNRDSRTCFTCGGEGHISKVWLSKINYKSASNNNSKWVILQKVTNFDIKKVTAQSVFFSIFECELFKYLSLNVFPSFGPSPTKYYFHAINKTFNNYTMWKNKSKKKHNFSPL